MAELYINIVHNSIQSIKAVLHCTEKHWDLLPMSFSRPAGAL